MKIISSRPGARLTGLFLVLFAVVAVLMVAGWFVARSARAREWVASELTTRMGMPVSVGSCRIGWPYALVLRNVASDGFASAGTPGFSAGEIRVGWWFTWRVELRQAMVRTQQAASGVWQPQVFARLADMRQASAGDVVRLTAPLRDRFRLHIMDGSLVWLDAAGQEAAALRDIRFRMEPVQLPESRAAIYYGLRIYAGTGGAMADVKDLEWAWLSLSDVEYIELVRSARGGIQTETLPVEGGVPEVVVEEEGGCHVE